MFQMLYPNRCFCCGELIFRGEQCCAKCAAELQALALPKPEPWDAHLQVIAAFRYEDAARSAVLQYKFGKQKRNAQILAQYMARQLLPVSIVQSIDFIAHIPTCHAHIRERGFDHCRTLTKQVLKQLDFSCENKRNLLYRTRNNKAQKDLKTREERIENVRNVFAVKQSYDLDGKTVLLIDDITTSGATLNEAVRVLRQAGASRVICLTFAKKMR